MSNNILRNPIQLVLFAVICIFSSFISVCFIDKPLTLWIHSVGLDNQKSLRLITEYVPWGLGMLVVVNIFYRYRFQCLIYILTYHLHFIFGVLITLSIKGLLKKVFGRYWPNTWINNNLSLIHDQVFGFNWLHGSPEMGSFPSGHTTLAVFCCLWLCHLSPRFYWGWLAVTFSVPIGLIMLNYHFLGDCLAGAALACLCFSLLGKGVAKNIDL